jgi:hypothetical protein
MSKERLDILLQSKLSHLESDVQDSERDAIFAQFGMAKKRRGLLPILGIASLCFFAGIGVSYFNFNQEKPSVSSNYNSSSTIAGSIQEQVNSTNKPSDINSPESKPNLAVIFPKVKPEIGVQEPSINVPYLSHEIKVVALSISNEFDIVSNIETSQLKMGGFQTNQFEFGLDALEKVSYFKNVLSPYVKKEKGLLKVAKYLKPELSFYLAPQFAFEKSKALSSNADYMNSDYISNKSNFESSKLIINAGFGLNFHVFSNMSIGTGIGYYSSASSYNYNYLINKIPIIDSATQKILGYIKLPDSSSAKVQAQGKKVSRYIELPLSMRFKLYANKKFQLGFEPSFSIQFLTQSSGQYMDMVSLKLVNQNNMNSRNGNFQFAFPLRFIAGQQTAFNISPFFGRTASNISNIQHDNRYRIYSGIKFSINYKIFK